MTESTFMDPDVDRDEVLQAADDDEVGLDEVDEDDEDEDFDGEDEEEDEEEADEEETEELMDPSDD